MIIDIGVSVSVGQLIKQRHVLVWHMYKPRYFPIMAPCWHYTNVLSWARFSEYGKQELRWCFLCCWSPRAGRLLGAYHVSESLFQEKNWPCSCKVVYSLILCQTLGQYPKKFVASWWGSSVFKMASISDLESLEICSSLWLLICDGG